MCVLYARNCQKSLDPHPKYQQMRDRRWCSPDMAQYRIEPTAPDIGPINSTTERAGQETREFGEVEGDKILDMKVEELGQSRQA